MTSKWIVLVQDLDNDEFIDSSECFSPVDAERAYVSYKEDAKNGGYDDYESIMIMKVLVEKECEIVVAKFEESFYK